MSILQLSDTLVFPAAAGGIGSLPVSEPNTAALASDGIDLYLSENGGPWTPIASAPSAGGWTDDGAHVRLSNPNDSVSIGDLAQSATEKLRISGDGTNDGLRIDSSTTLTATIEGADGDNAAVSASGEGRIRYSNSNNRWEFSSNASPWASLEPPVVVPSGWTDDGAVVRLTTAGDVVIIGALAAVGSEKLRVVGSQLLQDDFAFEHTATQHDIGGSLAPLNVAGDTIRIEGAPTNPAGNAVGGPIEIAGGVGAGAGGGGDVNIDAGPCVGPGPPGEIVVGNQNTLSVVLGNSPTDPAINFLGAGLITVQSSARIDPSDGGSIWGATGRDSSALVQCDSTVKGFAPPRMTRDQRDLIPAPLTGLEVHDTSRSGSIDYYDGSQWREVAPYRDTGTPKSTNYSAQIDDLIRLNATGGVFTVTLPTAVGVKNRAITIKEVGGLATVVTVATTASQTIDGAATDTINAAYQAATYISDGANWMKFV